jgi:hypothetical protein
VARVAFFYESLEDWLKGSRFSDRLKNILAGLFAQCIFLGAKHPIWELIYSGTINIRVITQTPMLFASYLDLRCFKIGPSFVSWVFVGVDIESMIIVTLAHDDYKFSLCDIGVFGNIDMINVPKLPPRVSHERQSA